MTRDEVIALAREAGSGVPENLYGRTDYVVMTWSVLERFAALVAAAEREACAKLCENVWDSRTGLETGTALQCVDAIRKRGESK